MLLHSIIAPDHPVLIPEIGGDTLQEVEESVNALLKLALLVHRDSPDLIILISPMAPILHKRYSLSFGEELVRTFAPQTSPEDVVQVVCKGMPSEMKQEFEEAMIANNIALDGYVQENNITAIDDAALPLLYYLQRIELNTPAAIIGTSDTGILGHHHLGDALGKFARDSKLKVSLVTLGHMEGYTEKGTQELHDCLNSGGNIAGYLQRNEEELLRSKSTLLFPLAVLGGVMGEGSYQYHSLGEESFGAEFFFSGYFE